MDFLLLMPGFILALIIMALYELIVLRKHNNVHFFVTKKDTLNKTLILWLGKPIWIESECLWQCNKGGKPITNELFFKNYGLNSDDFQDMKTGEIREVFINMED